MATVVDRVRTGLGPNMLNGISPMDMNIGLNIGTVDMRNVEGNLENSQVYLNHSTHLLPLQDQTGIGFKQGSPHPRSTKSILRTVGDVYQQSSGVMTATHEIGSLNQETNLHDPS